MRIWAWYRSGLERSDGHRMWGRNLGLRKVHLQALLGLLGLGICTTCIALPMASSRQAALLVLEWRNRAAAVVIDGYQDQPAYFPGELATVYLNCDMKRAAKLRLLTASDSVADSVLFIGTGQAQVPDAAFAQGYHYRPSFVYRVPRRLRSGVYHWEGTEVYFIVRSDSKAVDFLIVYPSNTEQAYNNMGGRSLYDHNSGKPGRAPVVSFLRPMN